MGRPDPAHSAVIRAYCSIVTILDYSEGFGHADVLTVSEDIAAMAPGGTTIGNFSLPSSPFRNSTY